MSAELFIDTRGSQSVYYYPQGKASDRLLGPSSIYALQCALRPYRYHRDCLEGENLVENKLISGDKSRLNIGKSIFSLFCPVKYKSTLTAEVGLESTF